MDRFIGVDFSGFKQLELTSAASYPYHRPDPRRGYSCGYPAHTPTDEGRSLGCASAGGSSDLNPDQLQQAFRSELLDRSSTSTVQSGRL